MCNTVSRKIKHRSKLQCLSSLGFTERQVLDLPRQQPWVLGLLKEKLKNNVDFLVNSVGFLLVDLVKCPCLLGNSLETRMIPLCR